MNGSGCSFGRKERIDRKDWKCVKLGEFELHRNNTCARSLMTSDNGKMQNIHYGDILVKFNEIVSLEQTKIDYLTAEGENCAPKDYIQNGDIVIADTAEDETVGKMIEVQDVGQQKVVAGLHTILYRPPSNLFARGWLGYWMNTTAYHSQLNQYMTGIKVLSLSKSSLANTLIHYPPKTEQQQIVAALDSVQRYITSLQALIAKYDAVKKATVNLLLKPKNGWRRVKIEDIFDIKVGGDLDIAYYSKTKTSFYRYEVVSNSLSNRGLYGYTSLPKFPADSITITGRGNVGHAEYRDDQFDAIVRIVVLTPIGASVCAKFVAELINIMSPFQIESTGVPQLTAPQIAAAIISLPPIDEQKRIVATLDTIDNSIKDLRAQLEKSQAIKQGMMAYFFG